jgi:hypothetical protein
MWVDVTEVETENAKLVLTHNQDHLLCEGTQLRNKQGKLIWVNTPFETEVPDYKKSGLPIQTWKCATTEGAWDNNQDEIGVVVPPLGSGIVTMPCKDGTGARIGPKRDCEFTYLDPLQSCHPGEQVTLQCELGASTTVPHVIRVCEASRNLQSGLACRFNDNFTLANVLVYDRVHTNPVENVVQDGHERLLKTSVKKHPTKRPTPSPTVVPPSRTNIMFTCPKARDDVEIGGLFSIYYGTVFNAVDRVGQVKCRQI